VVVQLRDTPKLRNSYIFTGVSGGVNYGVHTSSLQNMVRAVKERIFYVKLEGQFVQPFRPSESDFNHSMRHFTDAAQRYINYTNPMLPIDFANTYEARKKTIYLKAAAENELYGFSDKLSIISAFGKVEKTNFTAKPDAVQRVIQPRHPRYLIETGRYIKPIEKQIYTTINTLFNDTTVYKGLNPSNRGQRLAATWSLYRKPVAIGVDAKRFDQHVSNSALKWEHNFYQRYYPRDKHFRRLMKLQRVNKAFCRLKDGVIKYKTIHGRGSGDSNTSLGNVLIMCAAMYSYFKEIGVQASLINDGDDCVIITEACNLEIISNTLDKYFKQIGFTLEIEAPVYKIEHIVFCQSQPVFDGSNYLMVRDPRVAIAKDGMSIKPLDSLSVAQKWLAAVGKGGMTLTGGIPIWQDYYQTYIDHSNGAKALSDPTLESGFFRMTRGMDRHYMPPTIESRLSFF